MAHDLPNQTADSRNRRRTKDAAIILGIILFFLGFPALFVALGKWHEATATATAAPACVDGAGNVYDFVHITPALPYVVRSNPGAAYCRYEFPLLGLGVQTSNVHVAVNSGDAVAIVYDVYGTGYAGTSTIRAVEFSSSAVSVSCIQTFDRGNHVFQACPVEVDVFAWEGLYHGGSKAVAKGQLSQLFPDAVLFTADSPAYGVPQSTLSQAIAQYLNNQERR